MFNIDMFLDITQKKVKKRKIESIIKKENNLLLSFVNKEKSPDLVCSIFEFIFIAKEWAFMNGYQIESSRNNEHCQIAIVSTFIPRKFTADTELEALISACEWIFEQLKEYRNEINPFVSPMLLEYVLCLDIYEITDFNEEDNKKIIFKYLDSDDILEKEEITLFELAFKAKVLALQMNYIINTNLILDEKSKELSKIRTTIISEELDINEEFIDNMSEENAILKAMKWVLDKES